MDLVKGVILLLLILPTVPIVMGWSKLASLRKSGGRAKSSELVILVVVTCSQALMLLGLIARDVIGSDYSTRRFATIDVNLCLTAIGALVSVLTARSLRGSLITSSVWLTGSWLYMGMISSVV